MIKAGARTNRSNIHKLINSHVPYSVH